MFDVEKTTQVVAYFLWKRGGTMKYLKLMKLLYIAEREFLLKYGERLTGDSIVAMKHGPVLSETYDLFLTGDDKYWDEWIASSKDYALSFKKNNEVNESDPLETFDSLSVAEQTIIESVFDRFGHMNRYALRNLTHRKSFCPEWHDPNGTSLPINIEDILRLHGKSERDASAIVAHIRESNSCVASARGLG